MKRNRKEQFLYDTALISGILGALASVVPLIVGGLSVGSLSFFQTFKELSFSEFTLRFALICGIVILSAILIPALAYLIRRKAAQTIALQQQVTIAFLESLEKSSFNPMSKAKIHG
jgi:hypothetical protein